MKSIAVNILSIIILFTAAPFTPLMAVAAEVKTLSPTELAKATKPTPESEYATKVGQLKIKLKNFHDTESDLDERLRVLLLGVENPTPEKYTETRLSFLESNAAQLVAQKVLQDEIVLLSKDVESLLLQTNSLNPISLASPDNSPVSGQLTTSAQRYADTQEDSITRMQVDAILKKIQSDAIKSE